ncbi:hypothetical protein L873DRAFT_1849642 [Choiromyces venosus 120613-1]|uniref:Uncharacterized protein n=1 Tax=Choiromyces venosus 120613-1 TaxID=1336337 RepID=A0A3N4IWQ1_9PEZI|nr:hypothetical protein L873DRAFT_1849642 [Choiromyces venosus 120613-1]
MVGHVHYECYLLNQGKHTTAYPRTTYLRQQTTGVINEQMRDRQEDTGRRQQFGEPQRFQSANRENVRERHVWGTEVHTNCDHDNVQQSSAVNGIVVEVICESGNHCKHTDTKGNDWFVEIESSTSESGDGKTEVDENNFVKELTSKGNSRSSGNGRGLGEPEVMAGEKGNANKQPEQKKLPARQSGHRPIRLMAGCQSFDFVYGFWDTEVTGLTWRQFFDLSPEAIGDYMNDVYVIKDAYGRDHNVPREGIQGTKGHKAKVLVNPGIGTANLDEELVAELVLESGKSFEEVIRQIVSKARNELAVFQALEDYGSGYDCTDSGGITINEETDNSGTELESEDGFEESDGANTSDLEQEERGRLAEVGRSTSTKTMEGLDSNCDDKQNKHVYWKDENLVNDEEITIDKQDTLGVFGKEDIYSFRETGKWVTERVGSSKSRLVGLEELWRWKKERVETRELSSLEELDSEKEEGHAIRIQREEDEGKEEKVINEKKEKDEIITSGTAEAGSVKRLFALLKRNRRKDCLSCPTIYMLCQEFYEEILEVMHEKEQCLIGSCMICISEGIDRMDGVDRIEDLGREFEVPEVEVEERHEGERSSDGGLKPGRDELDEVFGQAGGFPTAQRPFESQREIDESSPMTVINQ